MADQLLISLGNAEEWKSRAACRDKPPALFFSPHGEGRGDVQAALDWSPDAALAVCARCPVTDACLAYALANREREGVWGGQDFANRKRRRWRAQKHPVIPCRWCRREFRRDLASGRIDYCSGDCAKAAHAAQQRESRVRRREKVEREATCAECGCLFAFTGRPRKFCSPRCYGLASSRTKRERGRMAS